MRGRVGKQAWAISQRGDTIVEVLIAMAVASGVLAITYATMNRNLLITRNAQERTEASKLAQGQLEMLKSATDTAASVPISSKFCFDSISAQPVTAGFAASVPATTPVAPALTAADSEDFTGYPTNAAQTQCVRDDIYHIVITRTSARNYRIYVRWERIDGSSRDEIIMSYRTIN